MHTLPKLARTGQMLLLAAIGGVCVTALEAQSHEVATVIELAGQVSVLRGGQEPLFARSSQLDPRQWQVKAKEEIVTGPDGYAKLQIGDGSTFEVFQNSHVIFQGQWTIEDMLQLILGKIRVQIEHRNGPNPKKISTPTAVISVRGTVFDVAVEDEDGTTYVAVEEGQVQVRHLLQPGDVKTLNQNEWVRVYPNQPLAKASGQSPALKYIYDRLKGAATDVIIDNPGGIGGGGPRGGTVGGGSQADSGKTKKPPPTTAPPGGGL
jgi:hypothetical protein